MKLVTEKTQKKITDAERTVSYFETKRVYLRGDDTLRVTREQNGSLKPSTFSHISVADAIKSRAWDTCQGTMTVQINLATDQDEIHPTTIYGEDVHFDGRKFYVNIDGGYPDND